MAIGEFCIDFCQLNDATIKDKFSIPLIEDLLNELQGVVVLLDLNLRVGYQQILMHSDDVHKRLSKLMWGTRISNNALWPR